MFSLQDALKVAKDRNEFVVKRKNGLVWIDYIFQLPDSFQGITKNFRGVIFDEETGELISLPLHKFFNLNQNEEVSFENYKNKKAKMFEKMDGSMVQFFKHKNKLQSSTRLSNETAQSTTGLKIVLKNKSLKEKIEESIDNGFTPIFELISPKNQIVIAYPKTRLVYLVSRNRKNGSYEFEEKYEDKTFSHDFEFEDINLHLEKEDFEGYVCYFENGEILKVKTQWYLSKHRTVDVLMRPKYNLYQIVYDGDMDDFIANAPKEYKNILQEVYVEAQTDLMNLKTEVSNSYKDALDKFKFTYTDERYSKIQEFLSKENSKEEIFSFFKFFNLGVSGGLEFQKSKKLPEGFIEEEEALFKERKKQEEKKQFFLFVEKNYPNYWQYLMEIYSGNEFEYLFYKNLMKGYKEKYKQKVFDQEFADLKNEV